MHKFYSESDIKFSLNNYTFKSRQNKERWIKGNYIKSYVFDLPKGIYDIFSPYYSGKFPITKKNDKDSNSVIGSCSHQISGNFSTRVDRKTKKIIPVLICNKTISVEPGNALVNSIDEAKELLLKTYEMLENKYDEVKSEKHQNDYKMTKSLISRLATSKIEDTDEVKSLMNDRLKLFEEIDKISSEIKKINDEIYKEKVVEVCNEIKNNDYKINEEVIEKVFCTTTYFEKSAIIQAVTEELELTKQ